jgi:hypothetical protein
MKRIHLKGFSQVGFAFCIGFIVQTSQAGVIFQEDWQANVIDPLKWIQNGGGGETGGAGGSSFLFDLNSAGIAAPAGDIGLFVQDSSFAYNKGVRSVMSFNRSQGLSASFKLMVQPGLLFSYPGPGGPWVQPDMDAMPAGDFPVLTQIEAGISRHDPNKGQTFYVEGTSNFDQVPLTAAFTTAFQNATSKANAIDVRVTLGQTTGARMEWSVGGGPVTVEFDTIGQVAGTIYGPGLGNAVSSTDALRLFFGGAADNENTRAVVDDIVVTEIPEPSSLVVLVLGMSIAFTTARRNRAVRQ